MNRILFVLIFIISGCASDPTPNPTENPEESTPVSTMETKTKTRTQSHIEEPLKPANWVSQKSPDNVVYPWKKDNSSDQSVVNRLKPPRGYKRSKVMEGSFGQWLRHLPLKEGKGTVYYHNGSKKPNQNIHAGVIDIDVGERDLQQCADAIMRLKAEYHYSKKEYNKIHFNYTSGHKVAFSDWSQGRKPSVRGNSVSFSSASGSRDNSYNNFKNYMNSIFNYAGTASLSKEMNRIHIDNIQIGDVFIQGGFPGHAVLVVDMAKNEEGEEVFMIAQSYMPAQDIHILKNLNDPKMSPWYPVKFGTELLTPEWTFDVNDLKRFK